MSTTTIIVLFIITSSMVSGILYVAFGQITVRKLRKNPKTRYFLGVEYASGWDIINVAQAFAFPRAWAKKVENSKFSFMYANASELYENTTKFDQVLGFVFYWILTISGLVSALLILFDSLGVFSE